MLFFIGFPFDYSQANEELITYKNSYLPFCKINTPAIQSLLSVERAIQCNSDSISMNLITPDSNLESLTYDLVKIPFLNLLLLAMYFSLFFSKVRESNLLRVLYD